MTWSTLKCECAAFFYTQFFDIILGDIDERSSDELVLCLTVAIATFWEFEFCLLYYDAMLLLEHSSKMSIESAIQKNNTNERCWRGLNESIASWLLLLLLRYDGKTKTGKS